ncbi:hypothetical protein E6_49 [Propionibacterium phage E6]|uniref:Nucleoside 2-deoxyribosyltransferase n=1 Tax=Propionibacterium phage E6 TaxID=1897536 RepID=A0A1D8EU53_9CAUD|nr:nucleoside 2-deoxyribosyltransferase [Propionibacterium phage E6]AOT24578.1 hypothetical protein E6_49 [Propionibacterium phage E6]
MKLYICGPMSGMTDFNRPAFREAAKTLTEAGYGVADPSRHEVDDPEDWFQWIQAGLTALSSCDGVATLDGHEDSLGATLEIATARWMEILVAPVATWASNPIRRPRLVTPPRQVE